MSQQIKQPTQPSVPFGTYMNTVNRMRAESEADKAKIEELEKNVKNLEALTAASQARKAQREEERAKIALDISDQVRSFDHNAKTRLQAELHEAKLEVAEWKKKYQERIDQEKLRAFGVSHELHQANEKLREKDDLIEHMKIELVKARHQAMGIPGYPITTSSGVYTLNTMSPSGLLSVTAPASDPGDIIPSSPPPINEPLPSTPVATEEVEGPETCVRVLELELKLALANHRLEQADSLAGAERKNYRETAEKLHAALSEITTIRKQLKNLSSEIYLARAGQYNAERKRWQGNSANIRMTRQVSQTNHQLQKLVDKTGAIMKLVDTTMEELKKLVRHSKLTVGGTHTFPLEFLRQCQHSYVQLVQDREEVGAIVKESKMFLDMVKMCALSWDSDDDEIPPAEVEASIVAARGGDEDMDDGSTTTVADEEYEEDGGQFEDAVEEQPAQARPDLLDRAAQDDDMELFMLGSEFYIAGMRF
ncbi:hypothetical protein V8F20_001346 [Naviculisporaceae sp. PSN 640]